MAGANPRIDQGPTLTRYVIRCLFQMWSEKMVLDILSKFNQSALRPAQHFFQSLCVYFLPKKKALKEVLPEQFLWLEHEFLQWKQPNQWSSNLHSSNLAFTQQVHQLIHRLG